MEIAVVFLALLLVGVAGVAVLWKQRAARAEMMAAHAEERAAAAVRNAERGRGSSRATIKGQLAEQLAPLLPGFPYTPSDFRFLGAPIDFVVFVGLSEAKEGLGDIQEIVLGDIKMGGATLSPHQRMIKRAVEEGRVSWSTLHIDPDFCLRGK